MHYDNYSGLFLSDGDLRLVGSSYSNCGRLEIYYNGVWGTVCDDGFSSTDARVAVDLEMLGA